MTLKKCELEITSIIAVCKETKRMKITIWIQMSTQSIMLDIYCIMLFF